MHQIRFLVAVRLSRTFGQRDVSACPLDGVWYLRGQMCVTQTTGSCDEEDTKLKANRFDGTNDCSSLAVSEG